MKKILFALLLFIPGCVLGFLTARWFLATPSNTNSNPLSPFINQKTEQDRPLETYSIPNLKDYPYEPSTISLKEVIESSETFTTYQFLYHSMGKSMTGAINIPASSSGETRVIVMIRGYVPPEIYSSGVGTKNAAAAFAEQGYITIAPDFFGFGDSDKDFDDPWKARFIKPINVIELVKTIQSVGVPVAVAGETGDIQILSTKPTDKIGIWAHSNGGQIVLSVLEVLSEPIPTTLWAPVTAPFPYSVAFFSDELEDEGKEQRAWIALFERDYNAFDFSVTQHLSYLTGLLQIHHGTADDAALYTWSVEFTQKIEAENLKRELARDEVATLSAQTVSDTSNLLSSDLLEPIEYQLFTYPGADHNLQPGWNLAIERDISFFNQHLKAD